MAISSKEALRGFMHSGLESFILDQIGIVQHKPHIQCAIWMKSHPDRIVQTMKIENVLFRHPLGQRFKNRSGPLPIRVIPGFKFAVKLQEPCITIRLFEVRALPRELSKKMSSPSIFVF